MNDLGDKALLPAGLQDILAPDAAHEAAVVERLIASFSGAGYERIKPPLLEFEEALLTGAGSAVAQQTFRLMDPVSQRMLALRADMTPQVARIAATRLINAPRPLRLCYGGQVLRVRGTQLRPERQFGQVGVELIGSKREEADAEVMLLAAQSLSEIGIADLTVDLTQPPLVPAVAAGLGFDADLTAKLCLALDRKDWAAVSALAGDHAPHFHGLLEAAGPAEQALDRLTRLDLPAAALDELTRLKRVCTLIAAAAPSLTLTVDVAEHRGFEYQTGVSFTLFARGLRGELGRGGRYIVEPSGGGSGGDAVSSTGFSLFTDTVLRALPAAEAPARIFLPLGSKPATIKALRADGWVTVAGLEPVTDAVAEARRLGCSHALIEGQPTAVEE